MRRLGWRGLVGWGLFFASFVQCDKAGDVALQGCGAVVTGALMGAYYAVAGVVTGGLWAAGKAEDVQDKLACGACPKGQACNMAMETPACRPTPGAEGEPCHQPGVAEGQSFPCRADLFCKMHGDPAACVPRRKAGGPCEAHDECEEGHVCREAEGGKHACRPLVGLPCSDDIDCGKLACVSGACRPRP